LPTPARSDYIRGKINLSEDETMADAIWPLSHYTDDGRIQGTGNQTKASKAHDDTVRSSLGTLATDVQSALATFQTAGFSPSAFAAFKSAMRTADINHHQRVLVSARQNSIAATASLNALRELGVPAAP
jgi:hypothetical protein